MERHSGCSCASAHTHTHASNLLSLLNGTFAQLDMNKKKPTHCHWNHQYNLHLADLNRKLALFLAQVWHHSCTKVPSFFQLSLRKLVWFDPNLF